MTKKWIIFCSSSSDFSYFNSFSFSNSSKLCKNHRSLALPHFSLVYWKYPQEHKRKWIHAYSHMPTKTNIHVYKHTNTHTHVHTDSFAITVRSPFCRFLCSLSLSPHVFVHILPSCQNFSVKRNSCVPTFWVSRYIFGGDFVLMVHAVHFM